MMKLKRCKNLFLISAIFTTTTLLSTPALATIMMNSNNKNQYQTAAQVDVKVGLLNKKAADITIKIPAEQAYGFKDEAATPEQNTVVNSVVDGVKQNINTIARVEGCTSELNNIDNFATEEVTSKKTEDGEKKKITTEFKVLKVNLTLKCDKNLSKQTLKIDLSKNFKNIKQILVHLDSRKSLDDNKANRNFSIKGASGSFNL